MTYNFDPDQWYDNQRDLLESRYRSGDLDRKEYKTALRELDRKLEEMWKRLDNTYRLPDEE